MTIGECAEERNAALKTLLDLRGQPFVIAHIPIANGFDGRCGVTKQRAARIDRGWDKQQVLIPFADAKYLHSMITYIVHLPEKIPGERFLHAETPLFDISC